MNRILLIFTTLLISVPALAVTASPDEVKNQVMQNCLGNNGDRGICECSYNSALKVMTLDDLALLQSQISSHVEPNGVLISKFTKATKACSEPGAASKAGAAAGANSDDSIGLPPLPPPPMDPAMADVNAMRADSKGSSTYLSDIKNDPNKLLHLKPEVDEDEAAATPKKPVKKVVSALEKKRPNGYFGQYDHLFFAAAVSGDMNALRAYATKVYDFDAHDEKGDTALIASIKAGQVPSMHFLIANGANINERNLSGQAPIHVASFMKRPDLVEVLIAGRAKLNESYGNGYTPLVLAIMQQDLPTVQMLLQNHAGFNRGIANGNTELHIAVTAGQNIDIIQALVAAGAKVNQKNKAGYTPLMVASYTGNATGCQALLTLGADPNMKDASGRNALALAQAAGKQSVVALLGQR